MGNEAEDLERRKDRAFVACLFGVESSLPMERDVTGVHGPVSIEKRRIVKDLGGCRKCVDEVYIKELNEAL